GSFRALLNQLSAGVLAAVVLVSDLSDVADVEFLNINDVFNDLDANALNDALSNNSPDIAALQNALNGNSAFENLLNGNNISISDIVGIDNHQDGSLIVYTNGEG